MAAFAMPGVNCHGLYNRNKWQNLNLHCILLLREVKLRNIIIFTIFKHKYLIAIKQNIKPRQFPFK
ncbi:MAG: hypothetical protein AMS26_05105 [Bacteroides sp. SM23_62]|nr:MAG: hypothetical protein AMS26_05105 [Bacteroides sp. SM23_62]